MGKEGDNIVSCLSQVVEKKHLFHADGLRPWLERGNDLCPVCKRKFEFFDPNEKFREILDQAAREREDLDDVDEEQLQALLEQVRNINNLDGVHEQGQALQRQRRRRSQSNTFSSQTVILSIVSISLTLIALGRRMLFGSDSAVD